MFTYRKPSTKFGLCTKNGQYANCSWVKIRTDSNLQIYNSDIPTIAIAKFTTLTGQDLVSVTPSIFAKDTNYIILQFQKEYDLDQ